MGLPLSPFWTQQIYLDLTEEERTSVVNAVNASCPDLGSRNVHQRCHMIEALSYDVLAKRRNRNKKG